MTDERKVAAEAEDLAKGLASAVATRVSAFGDLLWAPGMSREEAEVRDRDTSWRHGGEADAAEVAQMHVAAGRWTTAQAGEHMARLREQAARDRARVEEFDRQRAVGKGQA